MNFQEIRSALQDLIIRLQDAEKGFKKITEHTNNITLSTLASKFAQERHSMHRTLEDHVRALNSNAEVKTSILGDIHRMFMGFKFSIIDDDLDSVITEIERGANTLINDYEKIMSDVELPSSILSTLIQQKSTIVAELDHMQTLKSKNMPVEA